MDYYAFAYRLFLTVGASLPAADLAASLADLQANGHITDGPARVEAALVAGGVSAADATALAAGLAGADTWERRVGAEMIAHRAHMNRPAANPSPVPCRAIKITGRRSRGAVLCGCSGCVAAFGPLPTWAR